MATYKIHLPDKQEARSVFAVIVFSIFSWVIITFLYRLGYWALYLEVQALLGILAFGLVNALLESLFTFGMLLLIAALLPGKYFRDHFESQGTFTSFLFLASTLIFNLSQSEPTILPHIEFDKATITSLCLITAIPLLNGMLKKSPRISQWIARLAQKFTPFIFIYVPLSMFSLLYLIIQYIP